jgi:two-component system, sensor histidine kinase and response regulator
LRAVGPHSEQPEQVLITRHSLREESEPLRVLLAEDNAVNQHLTRKLLEKRGHTVAVAGNGREALTLLEKQSFDLVLMDVQMPEMDGFEATAAIREREKRTSEHLPIIAMTAHAMKGDEERCLGAGMDGYVAKPINAEDLFKVIAAVRGRRPYPANEKPVAAETLERVT